MNPTLCRLCAYFAPGLPRPTNSSMTRHPALARDQQKWKPVLRPIARLISWRMIVRQTAHTLADHALYFLLSPPPAGAFAPAAGALAPGAGAAPAAGAAAAGAPAAGAAAPGAATTAVPAAAAAAAADLSSSA